MGKLFTAAEYYDAADVCLRNAQRLDPGDMRWPYFLGHVFRYRSDPAKAAPSFEQALARAPQDVPSLVWLAEMNLARDLPEAAEEPLKKAQSLNPSSGAVLYGLGRVALAKRDYAEAIEVPRGRSRRSARRRRRLHYPLALAYRGLGNREKAEEHLRLRGEVELPPDDPLLGELTALLQNAAAYEARGSQALGARQWPEAAANLKKAVELAPGNAFTRLNLGTALYMQGDADGALEQYREAVRLSPTLARAHFAIGVLMESRGQDDEAIESFGAAISSDPGYTEPRFSLANVLRRTGRVQESLSQYAEVLAARPRCIAGELRLRDGTGQARTLPGGARTPRKRDEDISRPARVPARAGAPARGRARRSRSRRQSRDVDHDGPLEDTADHPDGRDDGHGARRDRAVSTKRPPGSRMRYGQQARASAMTWFASSR